MKNEQGLLKISEVAKLLNVHSNTLRKWDKGILKAVCLGERKDRHYRKEDMMKLVNSRTKSQL